MSKYLDYEGLKVLIENLYNGNFIIGKAKRDQYGNEIYSTYYTKAQANQLKNEINKISNELSGILNNSSNNVTEEELNDAILNLSLVYASKLDFAMLNNNVNKLKTSLSGYITYEDAKKLVDNLSGYLYDLSNTNGLQYQINLLENKLSGVTKLINTVTTNVNLVSGKVFTLGSQINTKAALKDLMSLSGTVNTIKEYISGNVNVNTISNNEILAEFNKIMNN